MKVAGFTGTLDQDTLILPRKGGEEIKLLFTALPLGVVEEIEKELIPPRPPRDGFYRDHKKRFIRDDRGRPIPFYDEQDPKYLSQIKLLNRLQTVAMLHRGLREDPNIEWEAKRGDFPTAKEFYQALYEEIKDFGFSAGELTEMINFMLNLSKLREEDVEEAREDFLEG